VTARITLDRYIYEDVYPAYKAATDEKETTAKINRAFLKALARQNVIFTGNVPLAVADIGCGPCDTLVKYLTVVTFRPGFEVRATDFLPAYADSERGEALQILAAARDAGTLNLSGFSTRAGDAFSGQAGGAAFRISGPSGNAQRVSDRLRVARDVPCPRSLRQCSA
jgi:hypothetical protein